MNIVLFVNIAKWLLIVASVVAGIFAVAFFIEYFFGEKIGAKRNSNVKKSKEERVVSKVTTITTTEVKEEPKKEELVEEKEDKKEEPADSTDLDEMLARLEEKASAVAKEEVAEEESEEEVEKPEEEQVEEVVEKEETLEDIRRRALEKIAARRKLAMAKEEQVEEVVEEDVSEEQVEEVVEEDVSEEKVEDKFNEQDAIKLENSAKEVANEKAENEPEAKQTTVMIVAPDTIAIDYETRLATIKENYAKIDRDYNKNHNLVLKYERTERRKVRNEKLLNKKATELTNLNLVLYNVKDLKSIDPEKKARQEEIANHIAELKESIKTADKYIEETKQKYENAVKFDAFLQKEKHRYEVEIKELEDLIKKGNK